MARVNISYDFDSTEEAEELDILMNHKKYYDVCYDIDMSIRAKLKYGNDDWLENKEFVEFLEDLRETIQKNCAIH